MFDLACVWPLWRRRRWSLLALTVTVGMTVLLNAVLIGVFSGVVGRYGRRVAWLSGLPVLAVGGQQWLLQGARSRLATPVDTFYTDL
jgi:hypothetical protein